MLLCEDLLYIGFTSGEVHCVDYRSDAENQQTAGGTDSCEGASPRHRLLFSTHSSHYTDSEGHLIDCENKLLQTMNCDEETENTAV